MTQQPAQDDLLRARMRLEDLQAEMRKIGIEVEAIHATGRDTMGIRARDDADRLVQLIVAHERLQERVSLAMSEVRLLCELREEALDRQNGRNSQHKPEKSPRDDFKPDL